VFDLLDKAESGLFGISTGHLKSNYTKADALYRKETIELQHRMERGEDVTGVYTGYRALDVVTGGWQPTDLIIIAARPSVGKTAFALNLAKNAALHPIRPVGVGIFSLEMSKGQIIQRIISAESNIDLDQIRRGKMDNSELQELHRRCAATITQAPIFVDDTPALNIFELRAKARRMVNKDGVGIIIIDYLQLMSGLTEGRNGNREQEISKISRDLKGLAKELHVPVIALCQLSREVEKRKGGEPQLSDLRESGAIEQDADFVGFLQRADYQQEEGSIDPSLEGDAELKIKKHRNGKLETVAFKTNLSVQRFMSLSEYNSQHQVSRFISRQEAERRFALETPPPAEVYDDPELPF
jgi:replicative DNA helicase